MNSLTLFFVAPACVFLATAALFHVYGRVPRWMALLPVLACYLCTCCILFLGGCHSVAHVSLDGIEADLLDEEGKPREIVVGGEAEKGQPSGIEIPGYPVDALRLRYDQGKLVLRPGPGYQRGLLVRSDDRLVPLEPSGLPRFVPLRSGDTLRIAPDEGGEVLAQWRLGTGKYDLNLDSTSFRWIGGADKGIAHVQGLADQVVGLRAEGTDLIIKKGAGFKPGFGVMLNGRRLRLGATEELKTRYQPDATMFALVGPDPACGTFTLRESGIQRFSAELQWTSKNSSPPDAHPFEMETGRVYHVGGALEDDFVVKGLPPGVFQLTISASGEMQLALTDAGKKQAAGEKLRGTYPQTNSEVNKGVRIGLEGDAGGGAFVLVGPADTAPPPVAAMDTSTESDVVDADPVTATAAAPSGTPKWKCAWLPNAQVLWPLPNREIVLPLINTNVPLGTRRPWTQQVFPLSAVTPMESGLRSLLVYGQKHDQFRFNGVNLLQFEPGIEIGRNGALIAPKSDSIGVLAKSGRLEFLQVLANEQGETHGVSFGTPLHPAHVWDARRVSLRKRFAEFSVSMRNEGSGRNARKVPVLIVRFEKPVTRSIPIGEVKAALKAREDGPTDIKIAINDRSGFSTLQHQVLFPGLSRWFDANADIQLNWFSLDVQDDYRLQPKVAYDVPFQIGDERRLNLRVTKYSVPVQRTLIVGAMGLVACALCLLHGATFSWVALFFGAGCLTCCRVLFGQAALVNPPFNGDIVNHAMTALIITPLFIGLGGYLIRMLLPGRIEKRLRGLEDWVTYRWLKIFAITAVLLRVAMLGFGFKEAITLGSTRVAMSIAFVPFYLLLFALCFFVLWRSKQVARTLGWAQVWPFIRCAAVLSVCQTLTSVLVSDLGMMLYFIPQALALAVIGGVAGTESVLKWLREDPAGAKRRQGLIHAILSGILPMLPLLFMVILFAKPPFVLGLVPGLKSKLMTEEQIIADDTDLVTDSTLLRVLQFTHREYLINLGTDSAERIAQDHAIMESYAHRGLLGEGYLKVDVLPAKYVTAMNDNVSAVYIFAQFGVFGALAVLVAYLAISLATGAAQSRTHSFTSWLALISGLSFSFVSIYMMAANYGVLPFTGRNMYLLGLNSQSDIVESVLLLMFIVLGITRAEFHDQAESVQNAASIGLGEIAGRPGKANDD